MTAVIVVGVGEWEKHTRPFLDSLYLNEPEAFCVVVDNGGEGYDISAYPKAIRARLSKTVCYAAALNYGIQQAGRQNWYIVTNNDVLIKKPFIRRIEKLDPLKLHGFYIHDFSGHDYMSGWCLIISDSVWQKVGAFDEVLTPMWFEDADYSIRCKKAGIDLNLLDRYAYGIIHLEDERHKERRQYMDANIRARSKNRDYVKRKHDIA